jgi:hypothetical protein
MATACGSRRASSGAEILTAPCRFRASGPGGDHRALPTAGLSCIAGLCATGQGVTLIQTTTAGGDFLTAGPVRGRGRELRPRRRGPGPGLRGRRAGFVLTFSRVVGDHRVCPCPVCLSDSTNYRIDSPALLGCCLQGTISISGTGMASGWRGRCTLRRRTARVLFRPLAGRRQHTWRRPFITSLTARLRTSPSCCSSR